MIEKIVVCPTCEGRRNVVTWFRDECVAKPCRFCQGLGMKLLITEYRDIPENYPPHHPKPPGGPRL